MSRPTSSPHHSIAKIKSLFYSNNPTQCFALCSQLLSSSQNVRPLPLPPTLLSQPTDDIQLHPLYISTLHFYTALLHEDIARSSPLPSTILRACEKALAHYHLAISAVQCLIPTEHRIEGKKTEQSDTYNLDELLSPAPLAAPPVKQEEARKRVDSPFEDLFEDGRDEERPDIDSEKLETLQPVAFQPNTPSTLPFPPRHHSLRETHLTHGISTWVLTLHQHIASVQIIVSRTKPSSPSSPRIKKVRFAAFEGSSELPGGETPDRETVFEVKERKNAWKRKGGYGSRDVGRWRRERFDAGGVRRFCEEVVGGMGVGMGVGM